MAEHARERSFPKGAVLLREGEPVPAIYFVVEGQVHIARDGHLLGHAGPRALGAVGALGLFARDPEGIGAVAETDVLTLELGSDAVTEIFEDHFPILHQVIRHTCRELLPIITRRPLQMVASGNAAPFAAEGPLPRELDLVERIFFLRRAEVFQRSSINALAELSRMLTQIAFPAGTVLWEDGDPSGPVFVIVSGRVRCATRHATFELGPGAPLGGVDSVAERPRWMSAVTVDEVVVLSGHREALVDVFEDNFDVATSYLTLMAKNLQGAYANLLAGRERALARYYRCAADVRLR